MTAVILAGGDGLRMRPLTCSMPKAMLGVCNVPLIEYIVGGLNKCGFSDIIIAADRSSRAIADHFDENRPDIPMLSFSSPDEGTSGALKRALNERGIEGKEPVLVVNGSALADFDYGNILCGHKNRNADITVILTKSARPWEGVSALTENGLLTALSENQPKESCASDLILTGSFVINAELAVHLPEYGENICSDVISMLLKKGAKIPAVAENGYFMHIYTPNDLLSLNADVINGLYPHTPKTVITAAEAEKRFKGISAEGKLCIGENSDIACGVKIKDCCVIGRNVTVGKGSKLIGCVIGDGVYIGEHCTLNHAAIGKAVRISEGASVFEGAAVGENSVIEESAVVNPGVRVWNGRHIEAFACVADDLKYGFARPVVIDDEGITGETNGIITPQTAAVVGSSLASIGRKIIIGCNNTSAAHALALALASGIMSAGGEAWFLGNAAEPELSHCVRICGASAGCYIDAGISAKLKFFSSDGLNLSRAEEKIIEGGINRGEYRRSAFSHFGLMRSCPEIREVYLTHLLKQTPPQLSGIRVIINTPSKRVSEICSELLDGINSKDGSSIVFHINENGTKLSAYTEETGYVFSDKLMLLCCREYFKQGKDVALPYNFPSAADRLAEEYGCRVLRYSGCSADNTDKAARLLAAEIAFPCDGIALMLKALSILSQNKLSLKEACAELPEFAEVNRFIAIDSGKWGYSALLRELLCPDKRVGNDGAVINDRRGRVLIRPVKTGKGLMMHVESYKLETASELCDFYQEALNSYAKKRGC
ncbi:MAG: NTP transferase domain-containing protein [Oscillospiraceae bacterium]|nr:NTP transferase domain-containing protein [Oscillospiraceae bacterium]